MAKPKRHFVVLGLGTFGGALALHLAENGCRVTGVDMDQTLVEALKDKLYEAVIANATERSAVEQLGMAEADAVFISLGEELSLSLLATLHAKEAGARRIIVKGLSDEHGKILRSLGVERVVFPEIEIARSLADQMTWPNVLDYVPIDPEHSVVEITLPESLAGTTLMEADLRRRFNIWVVGVKDVLSGKFQMFPDADFRFNEDQLLVMIGKQEDLNRFRELR
ncbi:MAG: TrkA family potassium uptake protein [Planctomycetes bacterium]|nr:TrkA family potassium uptake protein [Planctomycetota bacterium]